MTDFDRQVSQVYGHRVRLRACGLLFRCNTVLLARHKGVGPLGYLWVPPGGGVDFGETVAATLKREFIEETGLQVQPGPFISFHEYLGGTLHAVELFFEVFEQSGQMAMGQDPELGEGAQMITDLQFMDAAAIEQWPREAVHAVVRQPAVYSRIFGTETGS